MAAEEPTSSIEFMDRLSEVVPRDNQRAHNFIAAIKDVMIAEERAKEALEQLVAEYEEAYKKLTAPANRLGVFLQWLDEDAVHGSLALIALGDQEFVCKVDPKLEVDSLTTGTRVKVNEAYAVVGQMPPSPSGALIKVSDTLEDGRLRVGSEVPGSDGRLILRAAHLKEVKIVAGDEVRLDSTGRIALEHTERQESRDYFLESVPEVPWDKVGGQQEAIEAIRETIEQPLLHPEVFARFEQKPIKGMLLYGPPGCGKTLIGKATAYNLTREYSKRVGHEVKEYFMAISGPKILNMWLGETERMVREIFKTARSKAKEGRLVFIFMDEAESVLRTRSSGRLLNISNTVVPQFCAELDGLQELENVVLMLTSNRPDYIDPAVLRPGRIDRKVKVNRPGREDSEQILGIYLHAGIPLDDEILKKYHGDVDCARKELIETTVEELWKENRDTEFLKVFLRNGQSETLYRKDLVSGALLASIVDRAKQMAIRRAILHPQKLGGVTQEDLLSAIESEYKENEIFPKSDTLEDWLQLLDYPPENVATVKPTGRNRGEEIARKGVI